MPDVLIKDVPADLHRKLKENAARHHRSMTKQALILLEDGLARSAPPKRVWPKPLKPLKPFTAEFLDWAKKNGRE